MNLNELSAALHYLTQTEFLYVAGAALALVCLLILLVRRQPKNVVAYTTENGRVMVSRHAIVELVQTSCEQLQDVSKPQVKINVKGQKTHFEVRIKLLSGGRLRQIEQTLQSHLRSALTENLGIESLGRINIVATGFKSGRVDSTLPTQPDTDTDETYTEEEAFAIDNESDNPKKD
ncbi:MAG: hypothetical protein ACI9ZV_000475 [Candidatus Azotimanducaceae bacterium]|jgi:hypothetical protein